MWRKDAQGNNLLSVYRPDTGQDQQDQGTDQGWAELQGGECRRVPQVQGWDFLWPEYLRYRLVQIVPTAMVRYPYSTGTVVRWHMYWLYLTLIGLRCRAGHWYLGTGTLYNGYGTCTVYRYRVMCTIYCECVSSLVDYYLLRTFHAGQVKISCMWNCTGT